LLLLIVIVSGVYVCNLTASAPYFFAILINFLAWSNEPL